MRHPNIAPTPAPTAVRIAGHSVSPARRWRPRGRATLLWSGLTLALAIVSAAPLQAQRPQTVGDNIRGLPITRFYPFEEIGDVSRGARLSFDEFGRLTVIQNGVCMALNDGVWIDLADHKAGDAVIVNASRGMDGQWYYGALGGWGRAVRTAEGKLRTESLVPEAYPKWAAMMTFTELLSTPTGFYFGGWNGVVYFDFATKRQAFIPVSQLTKIFKIGDRVFVSSHGSGIRQIDLATQTARLVPGTDLGGIAIDQVAALDDGHLLMSAYDGQMLTFSGTQLNRWPIQLDGISRVSAICRLADGGVAAAVAGRGVYRVSARGEILTALITPEFHRVTALANREPGVLWVATESGVEKVLYGSPVTIFGQRLGLTISWPQLASWNGRVMATSNGRLYEAIPGAEGGPTRFEAMPQQPPTGAWTLAADGSRLLIGNGRGVWSVADDGGLTPVATIDTARLVMVAPDLCYVIGMPEIAALRWIDGQWRECAKRVPGIGYPAIVHGTKTAVWIELGPDRAARVVLHGDHLETRLFEHFPWQESHWINVGILGDTVVLTGPDRHRVFFDENKETLVEAPELQQRLDRAPFPINRVREDAAGTIWATHDRGVFTITRINGEDRFDTATFDIIDDHTPLVQLLGGGDVWISSAQTLYHVDRRSGTNLRQALAPVLISVADARANQELSHGSDSLADLHDLPYSRNDLGFRFFAASYAYRRPPTYEYRLNAGAEWAPLGQASLLNLPNLHEGRYHLQIALTDSRGAIGQPATYDFTIRPPWFRTWYSYLLFGATAVAALWALVRWSVYRTHARNVVLEQLVAKRTDELKAAMEKLNEETRNAATLAERNRLAGEIHDSLQQGLSGLMLNLDSTLKLSGLTGDVRSRLQVARKMLSFTRQEVQNAVWGLESPLLDGTDLGDALRRITALISPGNVRLDVVVTGTPATLSSATTHHLLRIAQEAVTNAVRHSGASNIAVQLDYQADAVALTITDNGRGFDSAEVLAHGIHHFGLRGLRGRALQIGGTLQIHSTPGAGTSISVTVQAGNRSLLQPHAAAPTV